MSQFRINPQDIEAKVTDWGLVKTLLEGSKIGAVSGFSIGLITYNKPHYSGRHEDYEAIYILEGVGTASIGGEAVGFEKGSLLVIPVGVEHSIAAVSEGPIKAVLMHFT